jgi:hypothetical protein
MDSHESSAKFCSEYQSRESRVARFARARLSREFKEENRPLFLHQNTFAFGRPFRSLAPRAESFAPPIVWIFEFFLAGAASDAVATLLPWRIIKMSRSAEHLPWRIIKISRSSKRATQWRRFSPGGLLKFHEVLNISPGGLLKFHEVLKVSPGGLLKYHEVWKSPMADNKNITKWWKSPLADYKNITKSENLPWRIIKISRSLKISPGGL